MRRLISAVSALLLLTTLGVVAVAGQTSADDNSRGRTQTFTLTSKTGPEADLDLGEKGFGLGDQFVFSDTLFRGDKQVGRDGGSCTIVQFTTETEPVTVNCVVTLELRRGQLTAQGLITFAEANDAPFFVAITGGTHAYKTAHGQIRVTSVDDATDLLRVELIL
jgi:allene oxide cyclase-like protein